MRLGTLTLLLLILTGCSGEKQLETGENFLAIEGGKLWYEVIGESENTPILLLHGGPAYPSYYLDPLRSLSENHPVIIFDQLGCGRSDRITDTGLMTIENHVDQIKELTSSLEVDKFHLYGHSWGSMLALEYYLKYPEDVRSLIFASPSLNVNLWESDIDTLITMFPDSVRTPLREMQAGIISDTVKANQAMGTFYQNHYFRKLPPSADLDSTLKHIGINVYQHMWGANDFVATGTLKDYDRTAELESIKVPTLYITGEFDAARPETVEHYRSMTPGATMEIIPDAGHVTMHDAAEENINAINVFLSGVENKN